jgi:hypothetical protein
VPIETFVGDWLRAGSIVGRGRRGLDVLVIRTPAERLEHLDLIEHEAKTKIAAATVKTVSAGYGVRLLPDDEDERLRDDARRTRRILGKLSLNLPCFGLWMPNAYWDLFQQAVAESEARGISVDVVRVAAAKRCRELEGAGIEHEVDAIIADLKHNGLVKSGRDGQLRVELLSYFRAQLARRTPELISRAVGFRTQRQALASDLDLRAVARSFFVDLVQATFAATFRTGRWPRRFHSFVGREFARRIARRCVASGQKPSDEFAMQLIEVAPTWEDENVDFDDVTAQVNALLGEVDEFAVVTIDELLHADSEGEDDGDDRLGRGG